jgi:hypothetical protein
MGVRLMAGEAVPDDDLPGSPVAADDLPGGKPALNILQKRMGLGKKGDTIEALRPYNVGGAATDLAAKVLPPEGAAAVGTAANLATEAAPTLVGGLVGQASKAPAAAEWLIRNALKPSQALNDSGKAARAVQTLLKEGLPVTKAGVSKMRDIINSLEEQATKLVSDSKGTISTDAVLERLKPVYERILSKPTWKSDLESVSKTATEMRANPLVGEDMTVQAAQALKEGAYRELGDKAYGMGLKPEAARDAQKAVARGLKEEIETVVPEVAPINARTSDLINAMKVTGKRTGVDANKNAVGLGWLIHDPASPAFWAWMAERSPAFKSALAHGLYSGNLGRDLGRMAGGAAGYATGGTPTRPVTLQEILQEQQK